MNGGIRTHEPIITVVPDDHARSIGYVLIQNGLPISIRTLKRSITDKGWVIGEKVWKLCVLPERLIMRLIEGSEDPVRASSLSIAQYCYCKRRSFTNA